MFALMCLWVVFWVYCLLMSGMFVCSACYSSVRACALRNDCVYVCVCVSLVIYCVMLSVCVCCVCACIGVDCVLLLVIYRVMVCVFCACLSVVAR